MANVTPIRQGNEVTVVTIDSTVSIKTVTRLLSFVFLLGFIIGGIGWQGISTYFDSKVFQASSAATMASYQETTNAYINKLTSEMEKRNERSDLQDSDLRSTGDVQRPER